MRFVFVALALASLGCESFQNDDAFYLQTLFRPYRYDYGAWPTYAAAIPRFYFASKSSVAQPENKSSAARSETSSSAQPEKPTNVSPLPALLNGGYKQLHSSRSVSAADRPPTPPTPPPPPKTPSDPNGETYKGRATKRTKSSLRSTSV